jgi:hypothetical protein
MRKRHKARKRGHAAKKKAPKKKVSKLLTEKNFRDVEKRVHHIEEHLATAGAGHARRGRARSKRRR